MLFISVITSAAAPGIALMTYFYLKDKYDQEPLSMVLKVFLLGLLIVFPIVIIQRGLTLGLGENIFTESFLISAGVEEAIKWFVMYHIIYNHTAFDEPYDGILYSVAISLGFATLENVMYAWYSQAAPGLMLIRALLPVSGHAMFGVIMGYHMGRAKFSGGKRKRSILLMSLLLPWFWHGVYDFLLAATSKFWLWYIIPLMAMLWYRAMGKVARANNRSPFRFIKRGKEINM